MGASPATIYQYLSGRRAVPRIALAAAKWALLVLGVRVEVSGCELAQLRNRAVSARLAVAAGAPHVQKRRPSRRKGEC